MAAAPARMVALRGCGRDDPDGIRTAAVLKAWVRVRQLKAFREAFWQGLAMLGVLIALTAPQLSHRTIVTTITLLAAGAAWGVVAGWTAHRRLARLIGDSRASSDPAR